MGFKDFRGPAAILRGTSGHEVGTRLENRLAAALSQRFGGRISSSMSCGLAAYTSWFRLPRSVTNGSSG